MYQGEPWRSSKSALKGLYGLHELLELRASKSRNKDYIESLGLLGYVAFLELLAGNVLSRIRSETYANGVL